MLLWINNKLWDGSSNLLFSYRRMTQCFFSVRKDTARSLKRQAMLKYVCVCVFVQVSFEDVIAEPFSVRSGDRVWFWSNALFEVSLVWFYRIGTAVLAIPFSVVAGVLFAFLTCLHIWYKQFILFNIEILIF